MANTLGGLGGAFEINLMMPLLAHNTVSSAEMLANAARSFAERCGMAWRSMQSAADRGWHETLALATALAPVIRW